MADYLTSHYNRKVTPQTQPIPGKDQVENSAGGYAFAVDDWVRLDRFLILGSEGGSYYATEQKLTRENAEAVERCIKADGTRTVNRISEISQGGRAPKNDPALFALALASVTGSSFTRALAHHELKRVARIGTHLFHWAAYREAFGGWGVGARRAVQHWYLDKQPEALAYQLMKYPQRDGWAHLDLLRLAHVKPDTPERNTLFAYAKAKAKGLPIAELTLPAQLAAAESLTGKTAKEAAAVIAEHKLPREVVPSEMLNSPEIWDALLQHMPMTAMIRNLAKMTAVGLLKQMSGGAAKVCERLADDERITKARVHPIQVLAALLTYARGQGVRGKLTWDPVPDVINALDGAFYKAFGNVQPSGKRILLALDVSGSMGWGEIAAIPGLTPRVGVAALALVTKAIEKECGIMAFSHAFVPLAISPRMRLDDVVKVTSNLPFGGTDCALPMLWAEKEKIAVDAFVVLTDSETWAGRIHPVQALDQYRRKSGIAAKLIVVGMLANPFSIADPNDAGMMDCVGFDTATPQIMTDFVKG